MAKYKIAWLPGDGIGKDVMEAAKIVLDAIELDANYITSDVGWEFWEKEGNPLPAVLDMLREHAVDINKALAPKLGVNQSAAITCVKPSGTVSQLVNSSSGIHPRYAPYYVRRVRNSINDPISQILIDYGVPYEIDVTNDNQYVFEFPIKSPRASCSIENVGALDQLELWKTYAENWCEHKPSVSIYVGEDEWIEVANWVYSNFDILSGVSFFPRETHTYRQAPYEEIDKQEYEARASHFGIGIEFDTREDDDMTTASQEMACMGGACDL